MKIRTRKVTVSKSAEEVLKIMKGASCPWARRWFDAHSFSFNRVVRGNGRISLIPVYGTVRELENQTEVTLEIHANAVCYLWGMISCAGVLLFLWQCILGGPGWRFFCIVPFDGNRGLWYTGDDGLSHSGPIGDQAEAG